MARVFQSDILQRVFDQTNDAIRTNATITSDIQIGAVEIKNSTDDTRATVGANGLEVDVKAIATGTNVIGKIGHDITGIADNRKVVTTAGTAVALAASTACKKIDITAETDNTGTIAVGGSSVVAALATRRGIPLGPGDSYSLEIDNLADVFIDSTVSGDGVTFIYFT